MCPYPKLPVLEHQCPTFAEWKSLCKHKSWTDINHMWSRYTPSPRNGEAGLCNHYIIVIPRSICPSVYMQTRNQMRHTRHAWMRPSPFLMPTQTTSASALQAAYTSASVRKSFAPCPEIPDYSEWASVGPATTCNYGMLTKT